MRMRIIAQSGFSFINKGRKSTPPPHAIFGINNEHLRPGIACAFKARKMQLQLGCAGGDLFQNKDPDNPKGCWIHHPPQTGLWDAYSVNPTPAIRLRSLYSAPGAGVLSYLSCNTTRKLSRSLIAASTPTSPVRR